jgi:glycosyltransferase involved in cell wall biosynthesis
VELGIADTVRFIPWIEREDLADVYASAQVFLYPSVEAQGLVVAEALSFGLPVVCTRATGPAELAGEAGFETTAEGAAHVDQLAERLAYLYAVWGGGDFAAVRETARARYENDLAWPRVVSTIASEYRSSDGRV